MDLTEFLLDRRPVVIGVVHLLPLPGSPGWQGDLHRVLDRAISDAEALSKGGVHAIIIENFGDTPHRKYDVSPETISAMTVATKQVQQVTDVPLGINVLRNDAKAAMAIASVTGAAFIRINVHTGAMLTDEGIIEGRAAETLRYRRALGTDVKIFADILVKHAVPLGDQDLELAARTAVERGLADALIVSGPMTGLPTSIEDVVNVKDAVPGALVLVGSGTSEADAESIFSVADGAIVGTSLKFDGDIERPVDAERVSRMVRIAETVKEARA
ncbi:MAG: BtpA/SgcQ family protein [Planctomycetes bacterium]|nr:BtpA/SgcQ family protein [Planctomycetota bacterium]